MKEITLDDAIDQFDQIYEDARRGEPSVVTRDGERAAALMSYERRLRIFGARAVADPSSVATPGKLRAR